MLHEDKLILIGSYPDPENGIRDQNAIAWHTQRTAEFLVGGSSSVQDIMILAEKLPSEVANACSHSHMGTKDAGLCVQRVWKKGDAFSLIHLLVAVLRLRAEHVLVQFEFNIFGGIASVLFLPFMLFVLRMSGRKVHLEMHQVVLDITTLKTHIHITHPLVLRVFNMGLACFYTAIGRIVHTVLVFEHHLKERLSVYIPQKKIVCIWLPIETKKNVLALDSAKKGLGIDPRRTVIMQFGFVNWYKGSDWVADAFAQWRNKDDSVTLLLAGGKNPTLKGKDYYETFYSAIEDRVATDEHILLSGFVPDNLVDLYFAAADLIVLPYRVFMSASGPFSLALSYGKPILISQQLSAYAMSPDFAMSLQEAGVRSEELFFPLLEEVFYKRYISRYVQDAAYRARLRDFSVALAEKRTAERVTQVYSSLLSPSPVLSSSRLDLPFSLPSYISYKNTYIG